MKELITEEQANQIVLALCVLAVLASLGFGFIRNSRIEKKGKKLFWANILIAALTGPATWAFWQVYNSIENYYGLDSVKALGINFAIAAVLGALFFTLFHFAPSWAVEKKASKSRK